MIPKDYEISVTKIGYSTTKMIFDKINKIEPSENDVFFKIKTDNVQTQPITSNQMQNDIIQKSIANKKLENKSLSNFLKANNSKISNIQPNLNQLSSYGQKPINSSKMSLYFANKNSLSNVKIDAKTSEINKSLDNDIKKSSRKRTRPDN